MLKYSTYQAKNKGDFTLSKRAMEINFELDADSDSYNDVRRILKTGECEGAVVVSVYPLYIAAYAKEMDAIVLLDFSGGKLEHLNAGLSVKSRLLTVNGYEQDQKLQKQGRIQKDLIPSNNTTYVWQRVYPIIADFTVDERDRLQEIKNGFTEEYWEHIYRLGESYFNYSKGTSRLGKPGDSENAFFAVDIQGYYKKTYGADSPNIPPVEKSKSSIGSIVFISVVGIIIYILIRHFAGEDSANIFKTIFRIIF